MPLLRNRVLKLSRLRRREPDLARDVVADDRLQRGFKLSDDLLTGSSELGAQTLHGKRYVRLVLRRCRCGCRLGEEIASDIGFTGARLGVCLLDEDPNE